MTPRSFGLGEERGFVNDFPKMYHIIPYLGTISTIGWRGGCLIACSIRR